MAAVRRLAEIHRRLNRLAQKQGKRKRTNRNSFSYESLEERRVLNAAPVGVSDLLYSTSVNTPLVINVFEDGLLGNDFDLDQQLAGQGSLFVQNVSTTRAGGTVAVAANGTFTYTPPSSVFTGYDYFTYQVADASSGGLNSPDTQVAISVGQSLTAQLNGPELIGDNTLHTGALQTTQSLGGGLELFYRSDATPTPIVSVETMLLGSNIPDSIEVQTVFGGISSTALSYTINPVNFDFSDPFRFVQPINASTLPTGVYDWTMTVTLDFNGMEQEHEFTGQQAVINRTTSEFGTGWWLAGLDRLHVVANEGALLENADGSTYFFADNGPGFDGAVGDLSFSMLEANGSSGFTLTDLWGDSRTFDTSGRITGVQRLNSSEPDFTYQYVAGKLDTITDLSGRVFDFTYNAAGFLDHVVDIAGRTTDVTIAAGLLTSVVVADEAPTSIYPDYVAPEWTFAWQTIGGQQYLQSVTDPANATTSYQFDAATRRLSLMTHADTSTWQLYPALTQGHIANGNVFQTSQSDPRYIDERGETFHFRTDGFGNTVSFVDARGAVTTSLYDGHGQLVGTTGADPDGAGPGQSPITRYGYSVLGERVLIVNADGSTQRGEYHSMLHRVTKWTDELGNFELFAYHSDGDLAQYTDAEGTWFAYLYDQYGNLTEEQSDDPDGPSGDLGALITKYIYDPAIHTRLVEIQINAGTNGAFLTSQTFTYTSSDQIASTTEYFSATQTRTTSYQYDPLDRLVRTTLPDPDHIGGINGPLTSPVYSYSYGSNLLIHSETDPLGNTTTYGYDPDRHFLTSVTQPDPDGASGPLSAPVTEYEYLPNGLLHREFLPEFTGVLHIEYEYNGNGDVISVNGPLTGQVETSTYDLLGRLETQTDASGRTISYQYDIRDRLTSVIDHDPDGGGPLTGPTNSYEYDLVGRVTKETDPLGRITAYVYYDNGLLHKSLIQNPNPEAVDGLVGGTTFEDNNEQIFDLQATVYAFDALNRLVSTTDPAGRVTTNVYNNRGQLVEVLSPYPNPDMSIPRPSTQYAYDWQGRVTSVTDALDRVTGYQYDNLDRVTRVTLPDPDNYGTGSNGPLTSPVYRY